ncbi:PucR family transcriptional regulator [Saccharopolyspora aridisoli]|uniref:PucR family transcriptional regulator n=1 Tax=Saccharopolyspora aridisoli TaxID=2530385 RepID=A0A4R4UMF7_9PSEU|nr:PucR family transcriptional regulator [Saccharopolyspora aridisoli]TDC91446.1 PucR family transcriptional regulator [Saccharopolyspora aridisoli]
MTRSWPCPSARVRELIRLGAETALKPSERWAEELHAAVLDADRTQAIAADPVLADGLRQTNVDNVVHWAAANVQDPGCRVPPHLGRQALDTARDLVRRGLDAHALDTYRAGQNVAWQYWMEICFSLTSDPDELRELLDVTALSISTYVNDTIACISERMQAELDTLIRGTNADRRAAVALILEGSPISARRAELKLGYGLTGPHTAAVVWSTAHVGLEELESAAEELVGLTGARRRLTVVATAGTLWVWLPVATTVGTDELTEHLSSRPHVRVSIGRPGREVDGFRRSHLDALTAQRMLARLSSRRQVARYEDVQLVALMTADPAHADEFVAEALGALRDADPEVRQVVRTYIREQCNASRTAERLYTHRNTVLRRLARADELLPRPLAEDVVGVGAALEVLRWRGADA